MSLSPQYGLLGCLSGQQKYLSVPLVGVSVEAEVHDFCAEVHVTQLYNNSESTDIEAVYHFPLDEASAVCGFTAVYEDGVTVDAVVKEKQEARAEYTRAVRSGKQAQLLESDRPDIFTMTVGRLPPASFIQVKITYIALLKSEGSSSRFLLPTHVAARYSPNFGASLPVPTTPSRFASLLGQLNVEVKFHTQSAIKRLFSPSHANAQASINGTSGVVRLDNVPLDGDLTLLCEEENAHQPRACVEVANDGSLVGLVTIFPEIEFRDVPREIVFIIDRSGSMKFGRDHNGKTQIQSAREALMLFLRALPPSCTFNIIGFGSQHRALWPQSRPYNDDTLAEATRYAEAMDADMGGTEILKPLQHALGGHHGRNRQVFVLTDGQVSNEAQVFACVRRGCAGSARTFCLGIGSGVSHHLVEGIARAGKGTAAFVTPQSEGEELYAKVLAQLKQALQPTLDNVRVNWNFPAPPAVEAPPHVPTAPVKTLLGYRSPDVDKPKPPQPVLPRAFPTVPPPVFNRERFVFFALFPDGHTEVPSSVTISAATPDGPLEVTLDIKEHEVLSGDIAHRLAARTAIREFEDCADGSARVSKSEALQLALRSRLASSQTSFVAVRSEPMPGGGPMQQRVVPLAHAPLPEPHVQLDTWKSAQSLRAQQQSIQLCCSASPQPAAHRSISPTVSWRACSYREPSGVTAFASNMLGMGASGIGSLFGSSDAMAKRRMKKEKKDESAGGFGSGGGGGGSTFFSSLFGQTKRAEVSLSAAESVSFDQSAGRWRMDDAARDASDEDEELACDLDCKTQASACAPPPPPAAAAPSAPPSRMRSAAPPKRATAAAPPPAPRGGVLELCMLQRADGSFDLDERLAAVCGRPRAALEQAAVAILQQVAGDIAASSRTLGTLAALLAMRVLFGAQRSVFEMAEGKGLLFLASSSGAHTFTPAQLEAGVAAMRGVLQPSQGA